MSDVSVGFLFAIAARTAIVLVVLLIAIRFLGKRQIGGMNVYDLVLMLAVANAVQNAMTKGSGQLAVGLASAGTLLLIGRVLGIAFVRRPWLEAHLVGTPTIILQDGRLDRERMRREGGVFTSDLSVNEFLLVKEAGFDPLGLVVGSSIYHIGFQAARWTS